MADALMSAPLKWRTMLFLLLFSGMRRGEACGLVWEDIDFENRLVHITKANQYLSGKGIFETETKTPSSVRVIKLPSEMMAMLKEHKEWQSEERTKMGDRWEYSGKVFTQENGRPIHPDSVTAWTQEFRESNDLPYFTPKALRHTSATLLIMSGIPVRAVAGRLGHANPSTTNTFYSHAIQTADALASDILGDIVKLKVSGSKPETEQKKKEVAL